MHPHPTLARTLSLIVMAVFAFQLLAGCGKNPSPAAEVVKPAEKSTPAAAPTATAVPRVSKQFTYLKLQSPADGAKVYERVELAIDTDGAAANPFDPAQVDIQVTFTGSGGLAVTVPAFYYQEYDRQTMQAVGDPGWRVRFTPTAAGNWTAQAKLAQGAIQSEPASFTAAENPAGRGFVRLNQANSQYFQYDTGDFYFPVGVNMSWSVGSDVLGDYERWLDRF